MERWNEWDWKAKIWWFFTFCRNTSITDCKPWGNDHIDMWMPHDFREKKIELRCGKFISLSLISLITIISIYDD